MVVITGAAGFIGSAMVWEFNRRGVSQILCVDDFGTDLRWKNLAKRKFVDFIRKDQLWSYLETPEAEKQIQGIIHIGACSSTTETNVDFLLENNTQYSQQLFSWCALYGKSFIYASSCATYGAGEKGFDDAIDSHELVPLNAYGYSKVLFDRWVSLQTKKPPHWVGLKYSNVYGPQEYHKGEQASVAFKAYQQIRDQGSLKLFKSHRPDFKDGWQKRDFIYIKDVVSWMWDIYSKRSFSGLYNMGYGSARAWMELAEAAFKSMGRPTQIDWIEIPLNIRNQYQYFTEAKMDRLWAQGLNRPQWSLEAGVSDYVENYLKREDPYL